MATTLSSPLPDPGGCLICQRLALAVVLVDLANTSKEIIRCFSITARIAGSHRSLRPDTARLPVQSVLVAIRQRQASKNRVLRWSLPKTPYGARRKIGRASCRERVERAVAGVDVRKEDTKKQEYV